MRKKNGKSYSLLKINQEKQIQLFYPKSRFHLQNMMLPILYPLNTGHFTKCPKAVTGKS